MSILAVSGTTGVFSIERRRPQSSREAKWPYLLNKTFFLAKVMNKNPHKEAYMILCFLFGNDVETSVVIDRQLDKPSNIILWHMHRGLVTNLQSIALL